METKFIRCGHVGHMTTSKIKGFIRVAEIRLRGVVLDPGRCPQCNKGGDNV